MCGINGIVDCHLASPTAGLRDAIAAMNKAIAHRGPDGEGEYLAEGVALGHRRLSILDLSPAGHQPMFNEDHSLVLVFNGEIYNYLELIPELKAAGHVFRSHSDSEVILHAYEQWGEACVSRFNGMWAFAIWDTRRRQLFMSRDRMGVKPFNYLHKGGRFVFSSEPVGILAVEPVREANLAKLNAYLAFGYRTNDGETFFDGIRELPPAHNAVLNDKGELTQRRYWSLPAQPIDLPPPGERVEAYRALLADAVRLRFRSDVPVALLQSGGLDSSAICAIVNDEIEAGRLGVNEITGYTAVHPGQACDESAAVRTLMATCPHVKSVELQPEGELLGDRLPEFVSAMQEPVQGATSYAHWGLMKAVQQQGIKVVINGQGADEALAGYSVLIAGYRLLDVIQTRPADAWAEAQAMHSRLGLGYGALVAQTAKAVLGRRAASSAKARVKEGTWDVLPDIASYAKALPELGMQWGGANLHQHLRSQLLDYGFNQILHYEDQSSMHRSIEIRSPFIDYRLMEFGFSLPSDELFSEGISKRILRRGFAQRLPASIVDNHRKIGFSTPFDEWAQTPGFRALLTEVVNSPEFRSRRVWDADRLAARMLDPAAVRKGFPVWRFLNAELWLRSHQITNA
ncbi:asparagine synthase (glutamine-hydrolyzing) [Roseateles sp.]|uniref:asparagine synthase (glutamine-hydrolyzing) n=1 Tax=Roseateles sp. TaxID=1971397 RepID=UPI003BA6DC7C